MLNVYVSEAETLTRLTDSVLTHHGKNPHFYSVVVKGEEVKVLPTDQVPESERFPKVRERTPQPSTLNPLNVSLQPIEHFRVRLAPGEDQYHNSGLMYGQHQHHQHPGYMELDRTWD